MLQCLHERENTLMHSLELMGLHRKSHLCFQPRHLHCTRGGRIQRGYCLLLDVLGLGSQFFVLKAESKRSDFPEAVLENNRVMGKCFDKGEFAQRSLR